MEQVIGTAVDGARKSWPTPQEYNEALQNLSSCFADPQLQSGEVELDTLGLPRPTSGAFASVYKVTSGEKTFAVRCFLHNVRDLERRYELVSQYVMTDDHSCTVSFEYQSRGVLVRGDWFPILKMDWVHGLTMEQYIRENLYAPAKLKELLYKFNELCAELESGGIAHGDLQHGNILVTPQGELRLVDYDGMFVHGMEGWSSNELGHRNYQHPKRSADCFGPYLDTFSKWSISASIAALIEDPLLYKENNAGTDCLLFRKQDFEDPENSPVFRSLLASTAPNVVEAARHLLWLLNNSPKENLRLADRIDQSSLPTMKRSPAVLVAPANQAGVDEWWTTFLDNQSRESWVAPDERFLFKYAERAVQGDVARVPSSGDTPANPSADHKWLIVWVFIFLLASLALNPPVGIVLSFIAAALFIEGRKSSDNESRRDRLSFSDPADLVRFGIPCKGTIKEFSRVSSPVDRSLRMYVLLYEYDVHLPDGRVSRRAGKFTVSEGQWDHPKVGEELTVLYNPHDNWQSLPYRYSSIKALIPMA